ncbi:Crp/Fnr family transcriptional regulator [Thermoactinospora rubra]|uniref:Crp/Fnr family transcriptional regulator n=1 Tax=Thermoactinospora rubra TaxID=1088767 RepID=UPI001301EF5D|nr:Crp/Fnr family transcriptional regulator [Thermoactinospora rubra]
MTHALAGLPMFRGVRLDDVPASRRRHPAGRVLCTQGDPADQLIVLLEGRVKAARLTAEGRELVLGIYDPPVAFDKTALLTGDRHRATLTAVTPVEVASVPREAVLRLIATEPAVSARLLVTLARAVRDLDERLADVALSDVPTRVARWLVRHAVPSGRIPLPGGQAGLGAQIGATRVSVNRALRGLERRGLIAIGDREVTVRDLAALSGLAGV